MKYLSAMQHLYPIYKCPSSISEVFATLIASIVKNNHIDGKVVGIEVRRSFSIGMKM